MELLYHFKGKQTQIIPPSSVIDLEGNVVDCVLVCSTQLNTARGIQQALVRSHEIVLSS